MKNTDEEYKSGRRDMETLRKLEEICADIRTARNLPQDKTISLAQGNSVRIIFNDEDHRQYSLVVEDDLSDKKNRRVFLEFPDGRFFEIAEIGSKYQPVKLYSGNKLTHAINDEKTLAEIAEGNGEIIITYCRKD